MEIVINIPEKIYSYVNTQWKDIPKNDSPISILCNAVIDGTPLPKGHGDLIDRNDLLEYTDSNICAYTPTINRYDIITAPTIIEADKGE